MAPKKQNETTVLDPFTVVLLEIMSRQESLNVDTSELGSILGLSGPKNVGRKLNSWMERYGFKYYNGKVILLNGDTSPAKQGNKRKESPTEDDGAEATKPAPVKKAKKNALKKQPAEAEEEVKIEM